MKLEIKCVYHIPTSHGVEPLGPEPDELYETVVSKMHDLLRDVAYCAGSKLRELNVTVKP